MIMSGRGAPFLALQRVSSPSGFFAVNRLILEDAYQLGMNPSCSLLVIAAGSGRGNDKSKWSCQAITKYTSIGRLRAKQAVNSLVENRLLTRKPGRDFRSPEYLIRRSKEDEDIWLPISFVCGAENETPPLEKLRQTGDVGTLQLMLDIYAYCNVADEGGLPWDIVCSTFHAAEKIADYGKYTVWGFNEGTDTCRPNHPAVQPHKDSFWERLQRLRDLQLLSRSIVAFDGEQGAVFFELTDVFSGESLVEVSAMALIEILPECFNDRILEKKVVIAVLKHVKKPVVRGLFVPAYRQHTKLTSAGLAKATSRIGGYRKVLEQLNPTLFLSDDSQDLQYQGDIKGISRGYQG